MIRNVKFVVLGLCATLVLSPSAWPCEPSGDTTEVVGFNADRTRALLRAERVPPQEGEKEPQAEKIELQVVELATGKSVKTYSILAEADPPGERSALRGKRWKAAETELKKQGFTIQPNYPLIDGPPFDLGAGLQITVASQVRQGESEELQDQIDWYDLKATRGKKTVTAAEGFMSCPGYTPGTERNHPRGAYLSPDKRFLLIMGGACETHLLYVLRVDGLAKLLEK
jgi:hypothetical protein